MKIKAAYTQRRSFAEAIHSGQVAKEMQIVYKALQQHQPCTRRELHQVTKLEISSLCRCLYDLQKPKPPKNPVIEVAFKANCKTTGKLVQYYKIIEEGGTGEGSQSI